MSSRSEIVRRYQAGDPVCDILRDASLGVETLYAALDAAGVPRRLPRRPEGSPPRTLVPAVGRACLVLRAVGAAGAGMTQAEFCAEYGFSLDVTKKFMVSLVWLDLLRRWPDGRYTLGPGVADLARDLLLQLDERLRAGVSRQEVADTLGRPLEWVEVFLDGGL